MPQTSNALEYLKREIASDLASSARAYYRIGISEYLDTRQSWESFQAAVGNLAISIELMLKAFIANVCFRKLFVGLPDELDVLLTHEITPPPSISIRRFEASVRASEYKMIELGPAISIFYIYFPDKRTELRSYFEFIAAVRNASVHGTLPGFQRYGLARVAYLAAKLAEHLREHRMVYDPARLKRKTDYVIKQFDHDRIEKVMKQIRDAREKSKKLSGEPEAIVPDSSDFEIYVAPCPVCGSGVKVPGVTEPERLQDEDGSQPALLFYPSSFHCLECGLQIDDPRDFSLVGLPSTFDRSGDFDEWTQAWAESYNPY